MFEKLIARLPKRRRLTRKALLVIVLLTLAGSFAIAWDKTMATQHRLDRAVQLLASGQHEESLELYNRVLFWWPHKKLAWNGKGLCELYLGRFDDALVSFDEILKLDSDNVQALMGKSMGLERLGRYNEALDCYVSIARIRPGVLDADRQIARLRKITGKPEIAE